MLDHADYTAPTRQRELDHTDHTDQESALKDLDHHERIDYLSHDLRKLLKTRVRIGITTRARKGVRRVLGKVQDAW